MKYYLIDCEMAPYVECKDNGVSIFNNDHGHKIIASGIKEEIIERLLSIYENRNLKLIVFKYELTEDGKFFRDKYGDIVAQIVKQLTGHDEVKDELNKIIDVNYESFGKEDYKICLDESDVISEEEHSRFTNDFVIVTEQEYTELIL